MTARDPGDRGGSPGSGAGGVASLIVAVHDGLDVVHVTLFGRGRGADRLAPQASLVVARFALAPRMIRATAVIRNS